MVAVCVCVCVCEDGSLSRVYIDTHCHEMGSSVIINFQEISM